MPPTLSLHFSQLCYYLEEHYLGIALIIQDTPVSEHQGLHLKVAVFTISHRNMQMFLVKVMSGFASEDLILLRLLPVKRPLYFGTHPHLPGTWFGLMSTS